MVQPVSGAHTNDDWTTNQVGNGGVGLVNVSLHLTTSLLLGGQGDIPLEACGLEQPPVVPVLVFIEVVVFGLMFELELLEG